MHLRTVKTDEEFVRVRDAWGALTVEPFHSFEWHYSWWKNLGQEFELRIYVFENCGEIVGIAPLFVDTWMGQKRIRLSGSGKTCTDYNQVITNPEYRVDFCTAIAESIIESASIGMIELEGVHDDEGLSALGQQLEPTHWRYDKQLEPTWVLKLPESWERFVVNSTGSLRRKIRKALKRMDSGHVKVRSTLDDLEFEEAFDVLVRLHQKRFISKGLPGVFNDDRFTRFLKQATQPLCENSRAEIIVCDMNSVPFGAQIYLLAESGPQMYQTGVCPDSMKYEPGHLMFTYAARKAIQNGYSQLDFLRGDEPYKPFWGAKRQPLLNIRYVSKQIAPTVINQAYRGLRNVKTNCTALWSSLTTST